MLFCPFCATMLLLEQGDTLWLSCTICSYKCNVKDTIVLRDDSRKVKEPEDVLGGDEVWNAADKVELTGPCQGKGCPSRVAYNFELQTRGLDEPKTQFYKCAKCHHRWRAERPSHIH